MLWKRHLADDELLLIGDGERRHRGDRAVAHLVQCPTCRERRDLLQQSLNRVTDIYRTTGVQLLPSAAAARARLQLAMAALSDAQAPQHLAVETQGRWLQAMALVVLGAGILLASWSGLVTPPRPGGARHVSVLPIPELTPGAVRPIEVDELCREKRDNPARIPASLYERVFRSYGTDMLRAADYELDYLITPELGGTADARNLWPQAYSRTPWNAFVKDELERSLHRDVCEGRIELSAAQRNIAGDWVAAYKQYFMTDTPLRDYDTNPLTAVDRDLLLSELEELGITAPVVHTDGSGLLALFHTARGADQHSTLVTWTIARPRH